MCLNPFNLCNLKQVGRSLFLLGKHKAAIDVYQEAQRIGRGAKDWETWHQIGVCCTYLKQYSKALENFKEANQLQRHDITYIEIGKVFMMQEKWNDAVEVRSIIYHTLCAYLPFSFLTFHHLHYPQTYLEALEFSPESPELLTTLGLLYLRLGENFRAFDFLGKSLSHDPRNSKTILAAGSEYRHVDYLSSL